MHGFQEYSGVVVLEYVSCLFYASRPHPAERACGRSFLRRWEPNDRKRDESSKSSIGAPRSACDRDEWGTDFKVLARVCDRTEKLRFRWFGRRH